jgi:hypothetical protein
LSRTYVRKRSGFTLGANATDGHVPEALPGFVEPMLLRAGLPPARVGASSGGIGIRAQLRADRGGARCLRSRPARDCSDLLLEFAALAGSCAIAIWCSTPTSCASTPMDAPTSRDSVAFSARATMRQPLGSPTYSRPLIVFDALHLDGCGGRSLRQHRCAQPLRIAVGERGLRQKTAPEHGLDRLTPEAPRRSIAL